MKKHKKIEYAWKITPHRTNPWSGVSQRNAYRIPHGRAFATFSKKVREKPERSIEESEVLFTITANSFENMANSRKYRGNAQSITAFKEKLKEFEKPKGNTSKAARNLKVFLTNFKENPLKINSQESSKRLHSSKEIASFSTRLKEFQRIRSSLKRKPLVLNISSEFTQKFN